MRRILVAFSLAVATLLLGSIGSTSAADYSVTLTCSDGTQFTATLDAAGAADLAEAVTAINAYPAGLPAVTCTLLQTPLTSGGAQAAGGPSHDFAVGGGQWNINGDPCGPTNFSVTAHRDTRTGEVHGTFNLNVKETQIPQQCNTPPSGALTADVACLSVSAGEAHMEVIVSRSSGTWPGAGAHLFVRADEGTANSADKLLLNTPSAVPCFASSTAGNEIEHGNIKIHVADSDFDRFSDRVEYSAGTDPWARCPSGPAHNAWPADLNNDGFSDIFDVSAMTASFGLSVPPAPARHNIAPDPPDGFVDIFDISRLTGFFGQRC